MRALNELARELVRERTGDERVYATDFGERMFGVGDVLVGRERANQLAPIRHPQQDLFLAQMFDPGAPFGPGKMLGEKPRRDSIARLAEFVDAYQLDEPGLHQIVERVEVLFTDFSHAAIVAAAGHQIMIAWPTENARRGARPRNRPRIKPQNAVWGID